MEKFVNRIRVKREYLFLGALLLVVAIFYMVNATRSSLWYDEGVEYFYSKVLVGPVPGEDTANMYQRICATYQPPLYNVLMYFWLLLFDFNDFSFRLSSILLTMVGGIGFYKCTRQLVGVSGALLGTGLYLLTDKVMYYGLECSEYSLMLCCLSWTLYFFVRGLQVPSTKVLVKFFVMAVLSVYSQYGAAFAVLALYLALLLYNRKREIKKILIGAVIVGVGAVLPLVVFFLLPQMSRQGVGEVSHWPIFETNLFVDYIKGIWRSVRFCFFFSAPIDFLAISPVVLACLAIAAAFFGYIFQWKNNLGRYLLLSFLLAYTVYFIAVVCSFYGRNPWEIFQGSENLGRRYCLFLLPMMMVATVYGLSLARQVVMPAEALKGCKALMALGWMAFCCLNILDLQTGWKKDDIREVTKTWYAENAGQYVTLVHDWSNADFQFYLLHNEDYYSAYQDKIQTTNIWIREASLEEMQDHFTQMGVFDLDKLYFVGPVERYAGSYKTFCQLMEKHGYSVTELYRGQSALLYLEK